MRGWIGFDLDGTLAFYSPGTWDPAIVGEPVAPMVDLAKRFMAAGYDVKIFTARVSHGDPEHLRVVQEWSEKIFGVQLEVTNIKDYGMLALFDDRAVQVRPNEGICVGDFGFL